MSEVFSSLSDSSSCSVNSRSFASRFEKQRESLQRVARNRMHPLLLQRIDTEDVVQDTFLAARQRLKQWKSGVPVPFMIWIRSIAIQTIQNLHRFHLRTGRRTLLQERPNQIAPGVDSSFAEKSWCGSATSPSQFAIRRESVAALQVAIEQLSDDDREIIRLRNFESLSNAEVAQILKISGKAASIRYIRALARLRRLLETDSTD